MSTIRPVIDVSGKTTTNYSLCYALLTEPVIQDQLLDLVLRFRNRATKLVEVIGKMYLQVKVHPDDAPFQRKFLTFVPNQSGQIYELQRITL